MKLHVLKNPNPTTRAEVREVDDNAPAPEPPWEAMTVSEFEAWRAAQPQIVVADDVSQSAEVVFLRLTDAERVAIFTSTDAQVIKFRELAKLRGVIRADSPDAQAGFAYLVAQGLLAQSRVAELLAP